MSRVSHTGDSRRRPAASTVIPMRRALLLAVPLFALSCSDDGGGFVPYGRYAPGLVDFGEVPTTSVRTMRIDVTSEGGAPLHVIGVSLEGDATKWTYRVDEVLEAGLAPGATASIEVTLAPCPERPNDPTACDTGPISGTLVITDDSPDAGARIELAAIAVLPARANTRCPIEDGGLACNRPDAPVDRCARLDFGSDVDHATCELFVELEAQPRDGATGGLDVVAVELLVRDLDDANGALIDGRDVGITVDMTSFEIALGDRQRLVVATAPTLRAGTWVGVPGEGGGLRILTNDPDQPEIAIPIFATSVAPNFVSATPLEFEAEVGTQTRAFSARNIGGPAVLTAIEIEPAEFGWSSDVDPLGAVGPNLARDTVELDITYDAPDTTPRAGTLRFLEGADVVAEFRITAGPVGAVPVCRVSPQQLDYTTAGDRAVRTVRLESMGFGECVIDTIDITGPGDTDDFSIDVPGCATLPCAPAIRVPAMQFLEIAVAYENDDTSSRDTAQLEIATNDPASPTQLVVLNATDDPCLPPTPIIMRTSEDACVGRPIELTASASLPGGRSTGGTIVDYQWIVRFGEQIVFVPPNAVDTQFTPERNGQVIVGLELENACGAMSTAAATEIIPVAQTCP